jgi:hypothetical protein
MQARQAFSAFASLPLRGRNFRRARKSLPALDFRDNCSCCCLVTYLSQPLHIDARHDRGRQVRYFDTTFDMAIDSTTLHTAQDVRKACRSGAFRGVTSGLAAHQVQANLIIVPQRYASDFRKLCQRNPVSCCLLGENAAPGNHRLSKRLTTSGDSDVRKDCPGYNVCVWPRLLHVADIAGMRMA